MRVPPFHSPLRGIGLEEAWHDHSECPIGKSIHPHDRILGTGCSLARCKFCVLLDEPLSNTHTDTLLPLPHYPPEKARIKTLVNTW
ncbi:hypothetical protein [Hymenobacter mucosus]|uniref:Uncharacterized protein n=1 Tax=Hymenobacter mucosus TaxID=1411120 RepID=A0A239BG70_9BACT|nr:hypothetical protein [Hymenobacter mucosus]SNS07107.1 hypothetical protein SAMN06269173_12338 [Hymenobacter mucosus]